MTARDKNRSGLLALLDALRPGAWEMVGGIPLVARTLYHLQQLGVRSVLLLLVDAAPPRDLARWQGSLELAFVKIEKFPQQILPVVAAGERLLYVDAAHLIDPRILKALKSATITTLALMGPQDRKAARIRAGLLYREDLQGWAQGGAAALSAFAQPLYPWDLDPFSAEIRGTRAPYFMEVRSPQAARAATRLLIRSQQKKVMDLPAEFIDPPFENALTALLCRTPVKPDMVTFMGAAIAAAVTWLFWNAHFVVGAFLIFAVEILDGVDGKLARTRLIFSRLGRYESLIDYVYESSWYAALAVGLSAVRGGRMPALLAGLLILSDTLDNIFYTLAEKRYGKSIDLFSPFDARFRRIAGRRNIYGMMFMAGFSLGLPFHTFAAAACWGVVTAAVHGFRLRRHGRSVRNAVGQPG